MQSMSGCVKSVSKRSAIEEKFAFVIFEGSVKIRSRIFPTAVWTPIGLHSLFIEDSQQFIYILWLMSELDFKYYGLVVNIN